MNLFKTQKEAHRLREQIDGYHGGRIPGGTGSLELTCTHCYI